MANPTKKTAISIFYLLLFVILLSFAISCGNDDGNSSTSSHQADDDDDSVGDDSQDDDDDDSQNDDDDDDTEFDDKELSDYIEKEMKNGHIPGLAAALILDGELFWTKGFGWAHIKQERPVTDDTIFMVASVSKTITATALMQLFEDGLFDLDDKINDYLPFEVNNPNHPETAITFRHLFTHTSSIKDQWAILEAHYVQGDSPIPLGDFMEGYLVPGGDYYSPGNYYWYEPLGKWNYSNVGAALIGYLVEVISGQPFDDYCDQNIFDALGMTDTSWFLADLDVDEIAMPYLYIALTKTWTPYGHYGFPDYPDGQLRVSVSRLAKFLIAYINGGQYEQARILKEETIEEMFNIQYPDIESTQGLIWYYSTLGDHTLVGHNGGDMGVGAEMFFRPSDGAGFIVLMNTDWTFVSEKAVTNIEKKLLEIADGL